MHEISPQTAQLAHKHTLELVEEGKSVEEVGKRLQSNNQMSPEIGQDIEASGKTIQEKAQKSLEKTEELIENNSTELFLESVEEHIDASQNHIEAVKEFQKGLQQRIDSRSPQ